MQSLTMDRQTDPDSAGLPVGAAGIALRAALIAYAVTAPLGGAEFGFAFLLLAAPLLYREARLGGAGPQGPLGTLALPVAALIAVSLISTLLNADLSGGLWHTAGLALMAVVGILAGRAAARDQAFLMRTLMPLIVAVTTVVALYALYQYSALDMRRTDAFLNAPNRLGTLLAFFGLLGAGYFLHRRGPSVWLLLPYGALSLGALATTMSRGGWVAAVAGTLFIGARGGPRNIAVLLIALMVFGGFLAYEGRWLDRFQTVFDIDRNMARVHMWTAAMDIFRDHPVIGAGPGSFPAMQPDYMQTQRWSSHATPHNLPLSLAADLGLVGLLAGGWILFLAARMGVSLWRRGDPWSVGLAAAMGSLLVNDLFGQGFYTFQIGTIMWFGLGMMSAHFERDSEGEAPHAQSTSPG